MFDGFCISCQFLYILIRILKTLSELKRLLMVCVIVVVICEPFFVMNLMVIHLQRLLEPGN